LTIFFKKQTITSSQLPLKMGDKMDTYNALGKKPERYSAFTEGLLAEAEDTELQTIVNDAAGGLSTPIALVTLVLERIQFFKAHYGLPQDIWLNVMGLRPTSVFL
jgi:hypothetical protein